MTMPDMLLAQSPAAKPAHKRRLYIPVAIAAVVIVGSAGCEGTKGQEAAQSVPKATLSAVDQAAADKAAAAKAAADKAAAAKAAAARAAAAKAAAAKAAAAAAAAKAAAGTVSQQNAAAKAADYLDYSAFSRSGLIKQLTFEGYSTADATWGVDKQHADWNAQAAAKAKDYLGYTSFSRSGLIQQLEFEGFTSSQARYGAGTTGL
jgi:colicin import membrane protein